MSNLLQKYPDTPLRDMAIFWLARAYYKMGRQQEAAKYMAQFFREYPQSPLKDTVEEGLAALAKRYELGQPLEVPSAEAKTAAEKVAAEKAAAEKAAAERAAALKAAAEKAAAERAAAERAAAERAAAEKAAAEKVEAERTAAEKAAAQKAAAERAAAERAAAEKAAAEKEAAQRVAAERAAAEKTAADKAAAAKAAAERAAAEKAAAQRLAAEKAAAEKTAVEKAAADRAAAERAAAEKAAALKVAAERAAAEKAAAERAAADKAAAERAAAERAAAQKLAAERAAAERAATERAAAERAAAENVAAQARAKEKAAESSAMRAAAIAAYKDVIDRFPGTPAAASASAKLGQLGVAYPPAQKPAVVAAPKPGETAQVFNLEVAPAADLDVQVGPVPEAEEVGKRFAIPFDIVNHGNGEDSFYLESSFPPEYDVHFAAADKQDVPVNSTPTLGPWEKFKGVLVGVMPRGFIDGQKGSYPIKAGSNLAREVSQSREIKLVASAPLLRAVVKTDKTKLLPGEKVAYRIDLLNIGSASARGVTVRLNYPPQYEPVSFLSSGFKQEGKGALILDGVQLRSGESRELNVSFQLKEEALAEQELFLRADVINNDLDKKDSFVSAATVVQSVSGVTARTTAEKLVVIPGQVVDIPLIITNTGNVREVFALRADVPANVTYTFFQDVNRDGKKQANEPIINHVGPLSPKEESYVVLEVATPMTANDDAMAPIRVYLEPENPSAKQAMVSLQLNYSRPVLEMTMAARGGRLKPGEVSSLEITCVNRGSNMAKQVVLMSVIPSQLELVATDPAYTLSGNGVYTWRFDELGSGEKRNIKVTYRVKPGVAVGTNMQMKNILKYQDLLGNRY